MRVHTVVTRRNNIEGVLSNMTCFYSATQQIMNVLDELEVKRIQDEGGLDSLLKYSIVTIGLILLC